MNAVKVKFVEIFTNGTISFQYKRFKFPKQAVFYEKDFKNSLFSKKLTKIYSSYNVSKNSYKSKYKF